MSVQSERIVYRLNRINGFGRVDAVASSIQASCDAEAIQQTETMAEGDRVELWQGARLVFKADASVSPQLVC